VSGHRGDRIEGKPWELPAVKCIQARQIVTSVFAVSLVPFAADSVKADLFSNLVNVAEQAAPALLDAAETAVEQAGNSSASADGNDPQTQEQKDQPAKSTRDDQTPDEAADDAKAQRELLKAGADVLDALIDGKPLDAVTALIAGAGAQLDRVLRPGIAAAARPILPMNVPQRDRDASMQAPKVTVVNPGNFQGDVVYFVNGIDVTRESALKEAGALAKRIQRPVGLIYNVTDGVPADLTEATYDRTWPLVVPVMPRLIQGNSTTRQVAHLIYHAQKPIAIVSHSQGCIIVRNALLMANTYTGGKAKDRIIWVATALPLRDEEISPKPARFRGITNRDDTVCQLIGFRLEPDKIDWIDACAAHDFATAYLDQVRPEDLR
jgi:hypothetical protein